MILGNRRTFLTLTVNSKVPIWEQLELKESESNWPGEMPDSMKSWTGVWGIQVESRWSGGRRKDEETQTLAPSAFIHQSLCWGIAFLILEFVLRESSPIFCHESISNLGESSSYSLSSNSRPNFIENIPKSFCRIRSKCDESKSTKVLGRP